jgi:hypothetical protein
VGVGAAEVGIVWIVLVQIGPIQAGSAQVGSTQINTIYASKGPLAKFTMLRVMHKDIYMVYQGS